MIDACGDCEECDGRGMIVISFAKPSAEVLRLRAQVAELTRAALQIPNNGTVASSNWRSRAAPGMQVRLVKLIDEDTDLRNAARDMKRELSMIEMSRLRAIHNEIEKLEAKIERNPA
jgi:hypothetical protein